MPNKREALINIRTLATTGLSILDSQDVLNESPEFFKDSETVNILLKAKAKEMADVKQAIVEALKDI